MRAAFDAFGFDTQIECADDAVSVRCAKRAGASVEAEKLALIEKRQTDKSAYASDPVALDEETMRRYPSLSVWQNGTEGFAAIKKLSLDAVAAQSADQAYRDELAAWMRFSDREAREKRDGVSADMMGLRGIVKSVYYRTTSRESAAGDRFARQSVDAAKKQLDNCGAFAVFVGEDSFENLIAVGRAVQAFWFDCAGNEIAVQPFSAAPKLPSLRGALSSQLGAQAPVQMILRLGYVEDYGVNCGLRRSLADYVEALR